MQGPQKQLLRVNIYSQNSDFTKLLKKEFEAVNVSVAVNQNIKKSSFTPDYVVVFGQHRITNSLIKLAQVGAIRLLLVFPLITKNQKEYMFFIKKSQEIPNQIFCKVVWVGGDGSNFNFNFSNKSDYLMIAPEDVAFGLRRIIFSFWSGRKEEFSLTDKIPQESLNRHTKTNKNYYQGLVRGKLITPKTNTVQKLFSGNIIATSKPKSIKTKIPKKVLLLVWLLVFVVSVPFILSSFGLGLTTWARRALKDNPGLSLRLFDRGYDLEKVSFMLLPLDNTQKGTQAALLGKYVAQIALNTSKLADSIFLAKGESAQNLFDKLSLDADRAFSLASFLASDGLQGWEPEQLRKDLSLARDLALVLPKLLEGETQKNFLVVLQDSSQPRSSGGKIVALGMLTFQNGKLINYQIINTSDVNKQIKGQIEPPRALLKYFGQTSWQVEEANWDPDFQLSAQKIAWFVQTALGERVDGVFIFTKPVGEEEDPSVLLEGLIENYKNALSKHPVLALEQIKKDITNKNLQIYLEDEKVQDVLSNINTKPVENLPTISSGLTVTGGKLNGLKKALNWKVLAKDLSVESTVVLNLDNTSPQNYQGYFRLLSPQGSSFANVSVLKNGEVVKTINPEIERAGGSVSAGVYLEVPKSESRQLIFKFSQPLSLSIKDAGGTSLYWPKQAGDEQTSLDVELDLTNGGSFSYNTALEEDFLQTINL